MFMNEEKLEVLFEQLMLEEVVVVEDTEVKDDPAYFCITDGEGNIIYEDIWI
jgi:hypothetical protein